MRTASSHPADDSRRMHFTGTMKSSSTLLPLLLSVISLIICTHFCSIHAAEQTLAFHPCPLFTNKPMQDSSPLAELDHHATKPLISLLNSLGVNSLSVPNSMHLLSRELMQVGASSAPTAQCATPRMPFIHNNNQTSAGKSIHVFVKKLPAPDAPKNPKALFLLSGGPGGDSSFFEPIMLLLQKYLPDHDMYYVEHRGVGRSFRLGCATVQAETRGSQEGVAISQDEYFHCAQEMGSYYPGETHAFSTTQAAEDLRTIIAAVRQEYAADAITLYGISYGTYWAQRFLQLQNAPNGVARVILDGVVSQKALSTDPLTRTLLNNQDLLLDRVGMHLMDVCDAAEDTCSSLIKERLSEIMSPSEERYEYKNGRQFVELVFDEVFNKKKCITKSTEDDSLVDHWGFSETETRSILAHMLLQTSVRDLIPSLLLRMLRCDDDQDYGVFAHIRKHVAQQKEALLERDTPGLSSPVLGANIFFSELWDRSSSSPSYDEMRNIFNHTHFADGVYKMQPLFTEWPKYQDALVGKTFSNLNIPIMLLNGNLDPQTPLFWAETTINNTHATCPNMKLFVVPYAPHFTLMNSKDKKPAKDQPEHCAMNLVVQFARGETGLDELDSSCLKRLEAPDFEKSTPEIASLLFGTQDIWDGSWVEPEERQMVDLYVFIAVEAATAIIAIVIICALIYFIVRLRDKQMGYDQLDADEVVG